MKYTSQYLILVKDFYLFRIIWTILLRSTMDTPQTFAFSMQFDETKKIGTKRNSFYSWECHHGPSHKRTEPWRFIVFTDQSLRHFLTNNSESISTQHQSPEFSEVKVKKHEMKARKVSSCHLRIIAALMIKQRLPKSKKNGCGLAVQEDLIWVAIAWVGGLLGNWITRIGRCFKHYLKT